MNQSSVNGQESTEEKQKVENLSKKEMGRYVQKKVEYPVFESSEYPNPNTLELGDKIQIITFITEDLSVPNPTYQYRLYTLEENQWICDDLQWLNDGKVNGTLSKMVEYADGQWCVITQNVKRDESYQIISPAENYLYLYHENTKELKEITPARWFKEKPVIDGFWIRNSIDYLSVNDKGEVIYGSNGMEELHIYQPDTGNNEMLSLQYGVGNGDRNQEELFLYDGEKNFEVIDLNTWKSKKTILREEGLYSSRMALSKDNHLYCISQLGIDEYDPSAENWNQLLDAKKFDFGSSDTYLTSVQVIGDADKEFYLTFAYGMEVRMICIYFDADLPAKNEKTLTICTLFDNPVISDYVTLFQYERNDIDVELKVLLNEDETAMVQDAIRSINTELVAGNGADLYVLNGLEAQNMLEKGVFVDLNSILSTALEPQKLIDSIVSAYTDGSGAIYQLPLRFRVPMYCYHSGLSKEPASLRDFMDEFKASDQFMYSNTMEPSFLYNFMIDSFGHNWLDENNNLKVELWGEDIQLMKEILETSLSIEEETPAEWTDGKISDLASSLCYADYARGTSGSQTDIASGNALFSVTYDGSADEAFFQIGMAGQYHCNYKSVNQNFISSCTVGMNAKATNYEEARDFLQFAFSEKAQSEIKQNGFPVNAKSLDVILCEQDANSEKVMGTDDSNGKMFIVSYKDITKEQIQTYKDVICSVDRVFFDDIKVKKLLMACTLKALTGNYDIETLAAEFENTLSLYREE